jgi:hypothetical protein
MSPLLKLARKLVEIARGAFTVTRVIPLSDAVISVAPPPVTALNDTVAGCVALGFAVASYSTKYNPV